MGCVDCNGRGWVIALNTECDITEIQRCGTCQVIKSDTEAGEIATPILERLLVAGDKGGFVVPKNIKAHGTEMLLLNLDLDSDGEARAEYRASRPVLDGDGSLTLRFTTEAEYNNQLAMAGGEVVKS